MIGYVMGKYYFEIMFVSGSSSGNVSVGIVLSNEFFDSQIGYDDNFGVVGVFQMSGNVYFNGLKVVSVFGYGNVNDVIGVVVDVDCKLVWFCSNSGEWNVLGMVDFVSGMGGIVYM